MHSPVQPVSSYVNDIIRYSILLSYLVFFILASHQHLCNAIPDRQTRFPPPQRGGLKEADSPKLYV